MKNFARSTGRIIGCTCLVLAVTLPAAGTPLSSQIKIPASPSTIADKVHKMTPGTPIEVRLKDKTRIRGRFEAVTRDGVNVQVARNGEVATRELKFADVESIKNIAGSSPRIDLAERITALALGAGAFVFAIILAV
jgi:hypothetical protein